MTDLSFPRAASQAVMVLAIALASSSMIPAGAAETWAPVASERLMSLPGESLEKAVDNDFARSELARRLSDIDETINLKQMNLSDMKKAVERADDTQVAADLQFNLLEEKRNYLDLVKEQQSLRRRRAETKIDLYEKVLTKMNRSKRAQTPERKALISNQQKARERMERTAETVDATLMVSTAIETSRYSIEYRKNLNAIQELMSAINDHPMNRASSIAGRPVSREEYLRQLITGAQGDLAIVEQEGLILGHMAKLVSLDALALAEGMAEAETGSLLAVGVSPARSPAEIIDIFIDQ